MSKGFLHFLSNNLYAPWRHTGPPGRMVEDDMKNAQWLLFDLGGVLIDYVGPQKLRAWLPESTDEQAFRERLLFSPSLRAFESGKMGPGAFALAFIGELGLRVGPDEFLAGYPDFISGWYDGAEALLAALATRRRLALLSNTNEVHWARLTRAPGCDRLFDEIFLSFRTGLLKPDAGAFRHVVATLGCAPEDILFFDDSEANVRSALACGLGAVRTAGLEEVKRKLMEYGLNV